MPPKGCAGPESYEDFLTRQLDVRLASPLYEVGTIEAI